MTSQQPWEVRHIYTTAEPDFDIYLAELRETLSESKRAGWITEVHDCPVSDPSRILPALCTSAMSEAVIVDMHGWVTDRGPWLGTTTKEGALLRDLTANSWSASIIFLTGCLGGTPDFAAELDRILTHRTTVVSHFEEAGMRDHTPIDLIKAVLEQAEGGDAGGAFNAVDTALYNHTYRRSEAWMADLRGPSGSA
jgi:hypothetical protein